MIRRLIAALVLLAGPAAAETRTLTDLAGREVTLDLPVERFVIGEGRYAPLLALLRPEAPMAGVVGMMSPVGQTLPGIERQLIARDPAVADIPLFGARSADSVSVERIIDLAPQLAIFGLQDHGPGAQSAELIAQLEAAGIAVLFIDFRMNPAQNTTRSIGLVGEALGAEDRAEAYIAFHERKVAEIERTVSRAETRPRVFFQAHLGRWECCVGFADGMLGPFVALAGGENIADAVAPGPVGRHTAEFLLVENPEVLIASASGHLADYEAGNGIVALGDGMTEAMAEENLAAALRAPHYAALDAVRNGRAHALWHDFYNSPLNVAALEALAVWIHPELFPDADPEATMARILRDFLGLDPTGVHFASLPR